MQCNITLLTLLLSLDIWTYPFLCSQTVLVLSCPFIAMCILQILDNNESLFCVLVKPAVIEMPKVKILNSISDSTPNRQFPVGTAIQLTCQGEVGSDASKVSIYDLCQYKQRSKSLFPNYAPKVWVYESQRQCTI